MVTTKLKLVNFDSRFLHCGNTDNIVAVIETSLNIGYKILFH